MEALDTLAGDMPRGLDRLGGARGLGRTVESSLRFSRSDSTGRTRVNIQRAVEKAVAVLAPSLPHGVSVETRLRAPGATVSANATQLHQVVASLYEAAIRSVGRSGRIRLDLRTLHVDAPRSLLHGQLATGHYVRLRVEDNGAGMTTDIVDQLFEPSSVNAAAERGGMDLSAVHGIVSKLGGAIDVRSEPCEKTHVTVWLPLIAPGDAPHTSPPATPRGTGQVVLIVDDEPWLLELAVQRLTELGYATLPYTSSRTALQTLLDAPARVDLVLTDENMPGLSGSELVASIRARRLDVPVIMMSGNVTAALEERARTAGVRELLSKPLREASVAAALARCLRSKAQP